MIPATTAPQGLTSLDGTRESPFQLLAASTAQTAAASQVSRFLLAANVTIGLGSFMTSHSPRSGGYWLGASVRLSLSIGHPSPGRRCLVPAAVPPSAISSPG